MLKLNIWVDLFIPLLEFTHINSKWQKLLYAEMLNFFLSTATHMHFFTII